MNRLISILAGVLALQLLLTALVFWPREQAGEALAQTALLPLKLEAIDRIIVSDGESSVLLRRGETAWQLPAYHGLPADQARVESALKVLPTLNKGWPVASSDSAIRRFEVGEDSFQRRISFYQGEALAGEIFLGTSPGFRKVHARSATDPSVYSVEFSSFELPAEAAEWLDATLLQLADPSAVTGIDYRLSRQDGVWLGDNGLAPDPQQLESLIAGLTNLRVEGAADIAVATILEDMAAPPTLTVEADGGLYEFRLFEMGDAYYIQRSDIPVTFSLSAFDHDRLNAIRATTLYPDGEVEEEAAEDG